MSHDCLLFGTSSWAANDAFAWLTGEFQPNGSESLVSVQTLMGDLDSHWLGSMDGMIQPEFCVQRRQGDPRDSASRHVNILAHNGPLHGVTLATCWIESGAFYWES